MKTILVTGAARGIGKAIVKRLYSRGCNVIFTYNRSEQQAKELASSLHAEGNGAQVTALRCNLANQEEVKAMVAVNKDLFSHIDMVVNNAGIISNPSQLFLLANLNLWWEVFQNNIRCVVNTTRSVLPFMIRKKQGRIVNITSLSGICGDPGQSAYAASKAAIANLSKTLGKELAPFNVSINCIAPGLINTDMVNQVTRKYENDMLTHTLVKRMGQPEEVAALAEFLLLDAPDYLVNQQIVLSGGL